jgi:hypothetical protein
MPGNPYYRSAHWRQLRAFVLKRDGGRCVVPGCGEPATFVDHEKTRPRDARGPTPFDVPGNCRSLCRTHDGQVKEMRDGKRANGGKMINPGCDASGLPNDINHLWATRG